jgi:hypothetical protein
MTGGFSPGSAFGPVVGTSAGTVGTAGAVDVVAGVVTRVEADDEVGEASVELLQPASNSANTAYAPIRRTQA